MKRNILLDFFRFLGVILVMCNHLIILNNHWYDEVFKGLKTGGWIGVDLFFVLSGYLVSGLIIKEYNRDRSFDAKRFLIRRGFKIYPTYYLFLILSLILSFLMGRMNHQEVVNFFHEAIFIANYTTFNHIHLWSINVEEHFYLFLALLFLILIKFEKVSLENVLITYIVLLGIAVFFRTFNYLKYSDYNFERDYTRSHLRFDALFFGVVLAYTNQYHHNLIDKLLKWNGVILTLCSFFLLSNFFLVRQTNRWLSVVNLTFNPICFGLILIILLNLEDSKGNKWLKPFAFIGKYSYSIYLFHKSIDDICIHIFKNGNFYYVISYFSISLVFGILISKLIEYPMIILRDRYFPSELKVKVT